MSLIKRFSKRLSRGGSETKKLDAVGKKPVELADLGLTASNPQPSTRSMTTADLFGSSKSTAAQSTAMSRTLYEIPQPDKVDAMTDLIKDHKEGDLFPYVGIVGSEGESSDARRARMLALKPTYSKRDVPEIKILGCPLISREGDFTMDSLMSFAKVNTEPVVVNGPVPRGQHSPDFSISKPYVHIKQVTILYSPNVSSTSNYCNLWMNLIDNRLIDSDKGSQTNIVVSNQESILEMSCDYCVSTKDLSSFTLSYTLERDIVHPGYQWGTASFYFSITESDLPYQTSKVDSMAVYRMPITTLMERETNADKSDISFTPADIVKLRKLYAQGDIVDVDHPQTARLKVNNYSKSNMMRGGQQGGTMATGAGAGWGFMTGAKKPKIDAYEASVDPDDNSEVPEHRIDQEMVDTSRREALARYKADQDNERQLAMRNLTEEVESIGNPNSARVESEDEEDMGFDSLFAGAEKKKQVRMNLGGV
jgi:hypothetical protein